MRRNTLFLLAICLSVVSIMIGGCISSQSKPAAVTEKYPDKPITVIVPFGTGGALDLVARTLEKTAIKHLGQPLIIVNKPGAAGVVGWNELASAKSDGYTIGISSSELFLHPLYGATKYNYPTALDPLAQISSTPFVIAIQANQPWQNANDLINYAKQHPGELKFSHSGVGSAPHVFGETFAKAAEITISQVPFQSAAEAMAALLGGHVQIIFSNPGSVKEYVKNGTVKVLAVASQEHLTDPVFAGIPTLKEQGLDILFSSRLGVIAPKEMPASTKAKLSEALKAIITDPEFKKDIENIGLQYKYLDQEQMKTQWLTERKELAKAVQETGIVELIKSQKH